MSSAAERTWRVGELATATGVSVRRLRHYDQIGLLRPSARRGAGPRAYTATDVARLRHVLARLRHVLARLRHVLALRGLGVPLADIAALLDGAMSTVGDLLTTHLCRVEQNLVDQQQIRRVLRAVLGTLNEANAIDPKHSPRGSRR